MINWLLNICFKLSITSSKEEHFIGNIFLSIIVSSLFSDSESFDFSDILSLLDLLLLLLLLWDDLLLSLSDEDDCDFSLFLWWKWDLWDFVPISVIEVISLFLEILLSLIYFLFLLCDLSWDDSSSDIVESFFDIFLWYFLYNDLRFFIKSFLSFDFSYNLK